MQHNVWRIDNSFILARQSALFTLACPGVRHQFATWLFLSPLGFRQIFAQIRLKKQSQTYLIAASKAHNFLNLTPGMLNELVFNPSGYTKCDCSRLCDHESINRHYT